MLSHDAARARDLHCAAAAALGLAHRREEQENGGRPGVVGAAAPETLVPTSFAVRDVFGRGLAGAAASGCLTALPVSSPQATVGPANSTGLRMLPSGSVPGGWPLHGRGHHGARPRGPGSNRARVVHRGGLAAAQG